MTQPPPTAENLIYFIIVEQVVFGQSLSSIIKMQRNTVSDCSQLAQRCVIPSHSTGRSTVMAIFTMKIHIPICAGLNSNKCPFTKESEFTCLCSSGGLHLQSASGWPACPLDKRHLQNSKDSVREAPQPRQPGTARNNRQFQEVRVELVRQKEGKQSSSWWERFPNTPF